MANPYYSLTFLTRVEQGDYSGVSLNTWQDGVVFDDDITAEDLQTFARDAFYYARTAQTTVEQIHSNTEFLKEAGPEAARIFGGIAKHAAIAQGWCDEYEQNIARAVTSLKDAGHYYTASALADAAERRTVFTVSFEILARSASAAHDYRYELESHLSSMNHTYGCSVTGEFDVAANPDPEPVVLDDNSEESPF